MTAPPPTPPNGHPVHPRPDAPLMTPGEKVAAEWEARHDVSARGSHGNPAAVQDYLTHSRSEQLRQSPPEHPPAAAAPAAEPPSPPTAAEAPRSSWLHRLFRRRT